jgi:hypothetical protein
MSKERFITVLHFLFAMLVTVIPLAVIFISQETEQNNPDIEITFPVEDIRCVLQDGKIVFCESYMEEWR